MPMLITVFTPVYNREQSIREVYNSLIRQTSKNFEWLVVNDGSSDSTHEIIKDIISTHDDSFPIRYYSKENEGLTRTINKALDWAKGELFFRLDSDDEALPDAIEKIERKYPMIQNNPDVCAIAFLSVLFDGSCNGYHPFEKEQEATIVEYRHIFHATGDRAEVMKLNIYRQYRFPEFEGEKFCSEGVVWDRIAKNYRFLYVPEAIYKKGFEEDSITSNIFQTLKTCCQGTTLLYSEIIRDFPQLPFGERLLLTIKYYRYAFYAKAPIFSSIPFHLMLFGLPLGLLVMVHDRIRYPKAFISK